MGTRTNKAVSTPSRGTTSKVRQANSSSQESKPAAKPAAQEAQYDPKDVGAHFKLEQARAFPKVGRELDNAEKNAIMRMGWHRSVSRQEEARLEQLGYWSRRYGMLTNKGNVFFLQNSKAGYNTNRYIYEDIAKFK